MNYIKKSFVLILSFSLSLSLIFSCFKQEKKDNKKEFTNDNDEKIVNLYSTRHYDVDKDLYKEFEKETGIQVNVVKSKVDALLIRMEQESSNPQADLFITTGFPGLQRAVKKDLMEPIFSDKLLSQTTSRLRDPKHYWYALSSRLRIIVIDKDYEGKRPQTYLDLSKPEYKGQLLVRTGSKNYNISWIASLISLWGEEKTSEYLKGFVSNFARSPEGNDRKQISDIYAKKGSITVVNSYYLGRMINSPDPEENKAAKSVVIIYPEDGIHENISGFSLIKNAKHKANALLLLEFMTSKNAQTRLTNENYEYPVNPNVTPTDLFLTWGPNPKLQNVDLESWGSNSDLAVRLINEAGWN